MNTVGSEPCAFAGPVHECTASVSLLVLGRPRGGHKDQGIPPIPAASPSAQAAPQEGGMSNPQMATFFQKFMAEMKCQASFAASVPPPSLVVSTPTAPAPISPALISSCHTPKPRAKQMPCT
ncbi:hypothetical protein SLEP1_g39473 [Rubroshorea leprosula]|uniref:Uncharacterized protein n=1 Tax=Rubroshorea leprosula TaxID=152421 RepID=A0AAV5L0C2_9ROSI|nr:hypothetical protein SLEP1_g39473 [Rubroshorea leprosula]